MEYTADNFGFHMRPQGAPGAMGVLGAGKYLVGLVGFDELADRATLESGFFPVVRQHLVVASGADLACGRASQPHALRASVLPARSALPKSGAHYRSVELRILVAGPLELEEVRVAGQRDRAVPHLACILAARDT